eukprot:scaffold29395_cov55-Attheya_sp.AAC.1
MTTKQELIQFLHQCLFCPPKRKLLKAIQNNQLSTWPGLTAEAVTKYLPNSCPATRGRLRVAVGYVLVAGARSSVGCLRMSQRSERWGVGCLGFGPDGVGGDGDLERSDGMVTCRRM